MTAFRIQAAEAWERLYRRKPPWRPAHFSAFDEAERVCGSVSTAMQSWETYLSIRDNKYFSGHSPILFAKHIEEFVEIPQPERGSKPSDAVCPGCDGNGWEYVEKGTTPRGLPCSGVAPCRYCRLGRKIEQGLRRESA